MRLHEADHPQILIIIPMYGKKEYTDKCVEMTTLNYGTGYPIEILVVDDGSDEAYVNPKINVLRLEKNSGFTNAVNQGILWGRDRFNYILLLNNDTEPYPGFLKELVDVMEADRKIGIAGSVRFHPEKEDQKYELCGSDIIRGYQYFTDEKSLPDIPITCNWLPLCSGLLRMSMIREIGLLDKRFRNHCSDSEYCLRAKCNYWEVVFVAKSIVTHYLSITTRSVGILVDEDQKLFLEKLAGLEYQKLMASMPIDGESKTWGKLTFEVYQK